MQNQVTVTVPADLWMSANRPVLKTGHRSRIVRELHHRTALAATAVRLTAHDTPVFVVWTVRYPRGVGWTHGDATNAHPTCKAILDGLVEHGYIPGDGPRQVIAETYRRGPNLDVPELHDIVLELVPATAVSAAHDALVERGQSR